jgi:hypothetical protein
LEDRVFAGTKPQLDTFKRLAAGQNGRQTRERIKMAHTLIAIASMAIATLFAFQQHRGVLTSRLNMIKADMAVRTTAVVIDKVEEITAEAFDEATVYGPTSDRTRLTPIQAGVASLEGSVLNDMDDYNALPQIETRAINGIDIQFGTRAEVFYVSELDGDTRSAVPTRIKKVIVKAYPLGMVSADTAWVSQVVSCGKNCAW